MITLEQAKRLRNGTMLSVSVGGKMIANADGTPRCYRVTGIRVWKRSPERVEIHLKKDTENHLYDEQFLDRLSVQ